MKTETEIRNKIEELSKGVEVLFKQNQHSFLATMAVCMNETHVAQIIKALNWVLEEKVELT